MRPDWMNPDGSINWNAKTPGQIEYAEQQRFDRERRLALHQKAVERRKKQKKNLKRSRS